MYEYDQSLTWITWEKILSIGKWNKKIQTYN